MRRLVAVISLMTVIVQPCLASNVECKGLFDSNTHEFLQSEVADLSNLRDEITIIRTSTDPVGPGKDNEEAKDWNAVIIQFTGPQRTELDIITIGKLRGLRGFMFPQYLITASREKPVMVNHQVNLTNNPTIRIAFKHLENLFPFNREIRASDLNDDQWLEFLNSIRVFTKAVP